MSPYFLDVCMEQHVNTVMVENLVVICGGKLALVLLGLAWNENNGRVIYTLNLNSSSKFHPRYEHLVVLTTLQVQIFTLNATFRFTSLRSPTLSRTPITLALMT